MAKFDKKVTESAWFSRGEEAAAAARQQIASSFRPEFWLKDGESAEVVFLDKESFNIHVHQLKVRGKLRKYTCRRRGCPLCRIDEPRILSVYRIVDLRQFEKKGGKKGALSDYKQKYYEAGSRIQPAIAKLMDRGALYKKVAEISRAGAGQQTTYTIIPIGAIEDDLRAALKKKGLLTPELDIETDYAPKSAEDLATLVELFGDADYEEEEDREEKTPPARPRRSYLEDEDEDEETASEEDEDEPVDEDEDE